MLVETNGQRALYGDLCVETVGTMWNPVTILVSWDFGCRVPKVRDKFGNRLTRTARRTCKEKSII